MEAKGVAWWTGIRSRREEQKEGGIPHRTLRAFAREIRMNPSHLSAIERGIVRPRADTLKRIFDELGYE